MPRVRELRAGARPGRADRSASRQATRPPNKAAKRNDSLSPAAQSRRAPASRGGQRRRLCRPPRLTPPIRARGPQGPSGGGIVLPPLRPVARGAEGSGDPPVRAQPGSGSARLMGSGPVLRHRRRVLIFPSRRRRFSARPRCPPSPNQIQLPLGRRRGAAAPESRKWLGQGARAVTPPRRDPGARQRRERDRAAPEDAPGDSTGPRPREAGTAPLPPKHPRSDFAALYFNGTTERSERSAALRRARKMGF